MPRTAARIENFAELLEKLGDVPLYRIRVHPPIGRATEKDLLRLLERDRKLCELVDGVLVEKVMGFKESIIAANLITLICTFAEQEDLGVVSGADGPVRLLLGLVRLPDVAFFAWEQLPAREYPEEAIPDLYPDLAIEVLSDGNTKGEMRRKLKEYFLAGTRIVWIVDPSKRIVRVFTAPDESTTLTEKDSLDGGDVLPGFRLPLKELFARVPRTPKSGSSRRKSS